jgi:D-serine deaminase-like pyridoxal phosphate-dependent protein
MDIADLPSPALVVDLATFAENVTAADQLFSAAMKRIRPHVKTHRTPALALRQLTPRASGLTCATVGEAEAMVRAGATDVLIANELVDRRKLDRVAALARSASVAVALDAAEPAVALGAAARAAGSAVDVLVDLDVGLARCGVPDVEAAIRLGALVERTRGLRLVGLMGYEGRRRAGVEGRARLIAHAYRMLVEAKDGFDRAGLTSRTVSAAGTSTLPEALADPTVTEIQAGTYALMEANLDGLGLPFQPALSVIATVISRRRDRVVLDAGRKSIASDYGPPFPLLPGAEVTGFNEEHTILQFGQDGVLVPALGDRVALRPGHVRLTFNLYDAVWLAHPDGSFESVPVAARGRSS